MHLDVDEPAQLSREELDMDAGAAIYLRGVLAGEDADAHASDHTVIARVAPGRQPRLG
jgi:hypothetical protein